MKSPVPPVTYGGIEAAPLFPNKPAPASLENNPVPCGFYAVSAGFEALDWALKLFPNPPLIAFGNSTFFLELAPDTGFDVNGLSTRFFFLMNGFGFTSGGWLTSCSTGFEASRAGASFYVSFYFKGDSIADRLLLSWGSAYSFSSFGALSSSRCKAPPKPLPTPPNNGLGFSAMTGFSSTLVNNGV